MAGLVVVACGSDDESSSTSGDSGSTDTGEASTAAEGGDCATEATKRADSHRAEVPFKGPATPIDVAKLEGKTFWFINAGETTFTQEAADGFTAAGEATGVDTEIFAARGTVQGMNQGINQAVDQKADGIVLMALNPELVPESLKRALDAGIPVVDTYNGQPDDPLNGLFAHVTTDWKNSGRVVADWIMADSGCDAHSAVFTTAVYRAHKLMAEGAESETAELCPDCTVTVEPFDLTKIATDLGTKTQSALRRNPDINYVFPVLDSGANYVAPAVNQSGRGDEVKLVSHDGVATNLDEIRKGGNQDADVSMPPTAWSGWIAFDQLARASLGMEPGDSIVPTRLIDESNIGESNAELFPGYTDFETKFTEAWTGGDSGS